MDFTPTPWTKFEHVDASTRVDQIRCLHARTREQLLRRTKQYENQHNKGRRNVIFEPGDLVWLHLRQEQFPSKRKSKLHQRGDGPFRVLEHIGMNAYKIELPDSYGVHPTFNVVNLSPYTDPPYEDPEQTGTFATQGGEGDAPPPPLAYLLLLSITFLI